MELLNGPEFKDMRVICQDTMSVFGSIFMEDAKCELFVGAVSNHRERLEKSIKPVSTILTPRAGRNIVPSRLASAIPPHIHDDNHTYEQNPLAKLSATIVGWREVKALTHYGVYMIEVVCSDGRAPKWIYKRYRDFERLYSLYGKLASTSGGAKVRMPSTSSSSRSLTKEASTSSSTAPVSPHSSVQVSAEDSGPFNHHSSAHLSTSLPTSDSSRQLQSRPSKAALGGVPAGGKSNKFDPDFHAHRAKELQPLLTALCERSDVFSLTKFMRWLHFERATDAFLMPIFQRSLQRTLDHYQIDQPIYSNNMIDALTWLMYLRIQPIWERMMKGIAFLAVRAVQDMILKAIRPLDDMISQLNTISAHIHNILKLHPSQLLRPQVTVDEPILSMYHQTFAAYDPPVRSLLTVVESELHGSILTLAGHLGTKLARIGNMFLNNILTDADEASVTALVTETESLFSSTRTQLCPLLSNSLLSLHENLSGKFNSNSLQSSFSAVAEITAAIPRFLDAFLPQQQMMDHFLRILKLRHATEALEANLTHNTLCALLNEIETEFERESEKIDALFGLRGRTLHAHVKRTPNSESLAAPLGDAVIAFGRLWTKYIRNFSRASSDLLSAQLHCTVPVSWSASVRDCIALALIHSNDYFTRKALAISQKLLLDCVIALFEPLTQSLVAQLCNSLGPIVSTTLATQTIPAPPESALNHPHSNPVSPSSSPTTNRDVCNLSELLESNVYLSQKIRALFKGSLESVLHETVLLPFEKAWEASPECRKSTESVNLRARLDGMHLRLRSELQKREMDGEARRDSFFFEERRATMAGNIIFSAASLPPAGMMPYASAGIGPALVYDAAAPSSTSAESLATDRNNEQPTAPPSFSEAPVARMLDRLQTDTSASTSSHVGDLSPSTGSKTGHLDDKRLGNDLVMLSRMSVHGGAKIASAEPVSNSPALIFNFDVVETRTEEPAFTASGLWAAANASQTQYKRNTRVFYDVPDADATFAGIDAAIQNSGGPSSPRNNTSGSAAPNSPPTENRAVPRKPTLNARIPRGGSRAAPLTASAPSSPASKAPSSASPATAPSPPVADPASPPSTPTTDKKRWTNSLTPGTSALLSSNTRSEYLNASSPPISSSPPSNGSTPSLLQQAGGSLNTTTHRPSLSSIPLPPKSETISPPSLSPTTPTTPTTPQFTAPGASIRIRRGTATPQAASNFTNPESK